MRSMGAVKIAVCPELGCGELRERRGESWVVSGSPQCTARRGSPGANHPPLIAYRFSNAKSNGTRTSTRTGRSFTRAGVNRIVGAPARAAAAKAGCDA